MDFRNNVDLKAIPTRGSHITNKDYVDNKQKTISWAEYQALSEGKKNNGTLYNIPDMPVGMGGGGFAVNGILYHASNINDDEVSLNTGWSSTKIDKELTDKISNINIKHALKVDELPTCTDNGDGTYTVSYVKDGVTQETNNTEQWFYFMDANGSLKQTIFIEGEEITIDGTGVNLDDFVSRQEFDDFLVDFQDGVNTIYDAVVLKGQTPLDKSPNSIKNAIGNITTGEGATGIFDVFPYIKMKITSTANGTITCNQTPTGYTTRGVATVSNGVYSAANATLVIGENEIEQLGSHGFPTGTNNSIITDIDILEMNRIESMYHFLSRNVKLKTLRFSGIVDTSKCVSMYASFYNDQLLEELDLSKFDTSNATTMACMLKDCPALKEVNVSSFDTRNVTTMSEMLYNCKSLISLDLSHFDVSKCTTLANMMNGCIALTDLNTSGWQLDSLASKGLTLCRNDGAMVLYNCTSLKNLIANNMGSKVLTNVARLLEGCKAERIEIDNLNLPLVTTIACMVYNCPNLTTLSMKNLYAPNVITIDSLLSTCKNLVDLDITGLDTSNVTNINSVFYGCSSLKELDLSMWDVSKVTTHATIFSNMPSLINLNLNNWCLDSVGINTDNGYYKLGAQMGGCTSLENLYANNWTIYKATNFTRRLASCPAKNIYANNWNLQTVTSIGALFTGSTAEKIEVENLNMPKCTSIDNVFNTCKMLKQLNLTTWDVSKVSNFQNMLINCISLIDLNLNGWNFNAMNTGHHTSSACFGLFMAGCTALENLYANEWKVETKTNFSYMLYKCPAKNIHANNWDLPTVTTIEGVLRETSAEVINVKNLNAPTTTTTAHAFSGNAKLREVDASGWNVPLTTTFYATFYNCPLLETVNFTGWSDTSKVTNTQQMFHLDASLKSVDLTPLNLDNVTNSSRMFEDCKVLEELNLSNWNTAKVTSCGTMFKNVPATCVIKVGVNWTLTEVQTGFAGAFTVV